MKSLITLGKDVIKPLQKYLNDTQISDDVKYIISQLSYENNQTGYALIPPPQQEEDIPTYAIDTNTADAELFPYF